MSASIPEISELRPGRAFAGQKEGRTAEAARPKENRMLNVIEREARGKPRLVTDPEQIRRVEIERLSSWIEEKLLACQREPIVECVTLSPSLATLLLARNVENRPVSPTNLERIKKDIEAGRWQFNGEAVILSKDGKLNDGQHRCRAVVETGKSIAMVIVFGPARESRMTLDQGVLRTIGNYLTMRGHHDGKTIGTVAGYAWMWKTYNRISRSASDRPTKTQVCEVVEHYKDIPDSLEAIKAGAGSVCSRQMLAFVHWAICQKAPREAADKFINLLVSGAGLQEGDPILYTRNRLIASKGSNDVHARAELLFRTWNAHRLGEKVERIQNGGKRLPVLER